MQAWNKLPSRISPGKLESVTSLRQFRVSRELACGQGKHGLSNVGRIHLNPALESRMPRDSAHMSDMAMNCLMSGADDSAAASAALSIPQAELCLANAECVTAAELGSAEGLAKWLQDRIPAEKPRVSSWGVDPRTKPVANLWTELVDGEISLEDSRPPKRTVHVASVKVRNEAGMFLIESHQEMDDGRVRPRNRPLSEKMRPGETVEKACRRGVFEELGPEMGDRDRVEMILETYQREEEERDSFSYPGLLTRYVLHTMVASVRGLPSSDFCTQEDEGNPSSASSTNGAAANGAARNGAASSRASAAKPSQNGRAHGSGCAVGVKKHHWKWVTDVELDSIMKKTCVLDRAPKGAVEVVLSYCHHSLNDTSLLELVPYLQDKGVGIISASPLSMGLLSGHGYPEWHPAPPELKAACAEATEVCKAQGKSIAQLALQYALRNRTIVTTLVGMSSVDVVRENVKSAIEVEQSTANVDEYELLQQVERILQPVKNMTWPSGREENN